MPTTGQPKGRNVREMVNIALEALHGSREEWLLSRGNDEKAMRAHVISFVMDYAKTRGVILEKKDIVDALDAVIDEVKETVEDSFVE